MAGTNVRRMVSACRSCGAPIIWAMTEATETKPSKRIPIDATEDGWAKDYPNGNMSFTSAQDPDGSPVVRVENGGKHLSHFANCPQSADWRRK